jgi:enolase
MDNIRSVSALEVFDSRGHPTVAVTVTLCNRVGAEARYGGAPFNGGKR